ncbi:probable leucine-rich repeat receptor-like protein kinase At5g63930 [Papaver somniferum]|uniref:probable leucine-rich repeat receptor-like protein kinase At5g63930 n=1 Tax=Papaver somniferum TaxID=3469 RepID=UPI000E6F7440|nr:probable leucine-rich repeat receptor-like protein kinase At5g63930 [Papaver somniferum]
MDTNVTFVKWVRGLVNLQVLGLGGIDLSDATSSSKDNFGKHISYLWNLTDLDISDCNIAGPYFPIHEFHNLSHLSSLRMNGNNSSIPLQLANLTSLSVLDMSSCLYLHGSIPYIPQLKELDVSGNTNFDPGQLTKMFELPWPNLETLDISGIQLTCRRCSISNAPNLVSLSASGCSIQGSLPSSIYNLSRLQHLNLFENNITDSIHSSISNLKDLNFLDLSSNNFQGTIPKSICEISSLRFLRLSYNNIIGTIPSCITNLRNLSVFDVSRNSITGNVSFISLINELNQLTFLDLSYNELTVVIDQHHLYPSKFKLEHLNLRSCNIQGFILSSICNFTHLKYLEISYANLTGTIPSCISKLQKLYRLDLSNNRLHGSLPLLPPGVDFLDLSYNKLGGEMSIEIGQSLSRVYGYNLQHNQLSGSIPSSLCSQKLGMSYTRQINLSNNKLSGIIPTSTGSCRDLHYLNLANNNLIGNVPNQLKHTNLESLLLNGNNLDDSNGSIPEDIFHSPWLQILDLSSNHFSGKVPSQLGYLKSFTSRISIFQTIYNGDYQLAIKGGTTVQLDNSYLRTRIDLSCNILGGNIPEDIGLLQGLGVLNLSHNHLSSNIPASVGNMSSLESLDLSSNRLSGRIPQSLALIDSLGFLNLSHNNLSGKIPMNNHFDTLSLDGSAFAGNDLQCGFPLNKDCDGDNNISTRSTNPSSKASENDREDRIETLLLYAIDAMGFSVGFWGLFFVLLIKKKRNGGFHIGEL